MQTIYSEVQNLIQSGQRGVLCTIVRTEGSTPRKAGAKMLLRADGTMFGTIGGGSIEFDVMEKARKLIKTNDSVLLRYELEDDLGMHCGGHMEVYMEPVGAADKLYIFGAGHVGKALARLVNGFGFWVTMIDERPGIFNSVNDLPVKCLEKNYFEAIDELPFDESTYVVVVTPKHSFDEEITARVSKLPCAYLGMIGSKAKIALARKRFKEEFWLTDNQIDQIDMPIGIPFMVETPEEICISIIARLIDVKNKKCKNF